MSRKILSAVLMCGFVLLPGKTEAQCNNQLALPTITAVSGAATLTSPVQAQFAQGFTSGQHNVTVTSRNNGQDWVLRVSRTAGASPLPGNVSVSLDGTTFTAVPATGALVNIRTAKGCVTFPVYWRMTTAWTTTPPGTYSSPITYSLDVGTAPMNSSVGVTVGHVAAVSASPTSVDLGAKLQQNATTTSAVNTTVTHAGNAPYTIRLSSGTGATIPGPGGSSKSVADLGISTNGGSTWISVPTSGFSTILTVGAAGTGSFTASHRLTTYTSDVIGAYSPTYTLQAVPSTAGSTQSQSVNGSFSVQSSDLAVTVNSGALVSFGTINGSGPFTAGTTSSITHTSIYTHDVTVHAASAFWSSASGQNNSVLAASALSITTNGGGTWTSLSTTPHVLVLNAPPGTYNNALTVGYRLTPGTLPADNYTLLVTFSAVAK
jgi:hypothetical protein